MVRQTELLQFRGAARLIVAPPKSIKAEWRCVIVDNAIVASSQYRPTYCSGCPDYIHNFVTQVNRSVVAPCRAFVMDVAETPDGPRVIEIGCVCCVAFYAAIARDIIERLATL